MRQVHGNRIRAKRTEVDGHLFASKAEALEYMRLKMLMAAGEIRDLEIQPKWPIEINGVKVCDVIADFRFFDERESRWRVTDRHPIDTSISRLKRKLVKAAHNIDIEVV